MNRPQPAMRARPGGGFNQGMGSFNEHMDESAMQQAVQQKALGQQSSKPSSQHIAQQAAQQQMSNGGQQQPPRETGTLVQELVTRPAQDVVKGLLSIFDLNAILGVSPAQENPQDKAKKQQVLQRFNKLTEEDQAQVKKTYHERLKQKEAEEQEKEQRKQIEQQQKAQQVSMPSSPKKGPVGPSGSKKQKAQQKLQNDRQKLGGPQGSN